MLKIWWWFFEQSDCIYTWPECVDCLPGNAKFNYDQLKISSFQQSCYHSSQTLLDFNFHNFSWITLKRMTNITIHCTIRNLIRVLCLQFTCKFSVLFASTCIEVALLFAQTMFAAQINYALLFDLKIQHHLHWFSVKRVQWNLQTNKQTNIQNLNENHSKGKI